MKRNKINLNEELNRMLELAGSNLINGKHLVVVDIQPEYESGFDRDFLNEFINFFK